MGPAHLVHHHTSPGPAEPPVPRRVLFSCVVPLLLLMEHGCILAAGQPSLISGADRLTFVEQARLDLHVVQRCGCRVLPRAGCFSLHSLGSAVVLAEGSSLCTEHGSWMAPHPSDHPQRASIPVTGLGDAGLTVLTSLEVVTGCYWFPTAALCHLGAGTWHAAVISSLLPFPGSFLGMKQEKRLCCPGTPHAVSCLSPPDPPHAGAGAVQQLGSDIY